MTELINAITNTQMWVADNRVDEYLAAGHKYPAVTVKPTEEKPKKEVSKKTTAKRGK